LQTSALADQGESVTEQRYLSYLLRIWQTCDGQKEIWRASLESPGTGERRGFADLESLFAFLAAEVGKDRSPDQLDKCQDAKGETQGVIT
jgi:hypothetical protein